MEDSFKDQLERKYNEFRKTGLESYLNYLVKEEKNAAGKAIKKKYHNYLVNEINSTRLKIEKIDEKL